MKKKSNSCLLNMSRFIEAGFTLKNSHSIAYFILSVFVFRTTFLESLFKRYPSISLCFHLGDTYGKHIVVE